MTKEDKKRKSLIERSLTGLEIGQLKALNAMLFCAWPAGNPDAFAWNERVRGLISSEINSRLREHV